MSDFTYENHDSRDIYETFEWDNTWIEHANKMGVKRVLYIGDSISCQTRKHATKLTEGELLFDGYGSSKGIDNPYLMNSIRLFALQEGHRDVVLFNNGLHGWHLNDATEYKNCYENVVQALIQEFRDVPLFLVLTTHVAGDRREKRVIARNEAVMEIAKKYNLPIIDLYTESLKNDEYLQECGVHYNEAGNICLAKKIVSSVKTVL